MAKNPLDVDALLNAAAASKPNRTKSKTPEVTIKNLDSEIAKWIAAHQAIATATAELRQAEAAILPAALKARKEACRQMGSFASGAVVNGALMATWQNKYSVIPLEAGADLEKAFGEDWQQYFTKVTEVSLTDKAVQDADALRKMIEAAGAEKFKEYFNVSISFSPTEKLHQGIVMDEKVDTKAQKLLDANILKPYKGAIKPK